MRISGWMIRGLAGALALVSSVPAMADPPAREQATRAAPERTATGDEAIFAEFADLNTDATRQRLEALSSDENFLAISELLGKEGTTSADVESHVLPLVEGKPPADVEVTLAAIMLHAYNRHQRAQLRLGTQDELYVKGALIDLDNVVTTAAYGRERGRRYRSLSRHRR